MSVDLIVIVPTRSRPHAVAPIVEAWAETGAWDDGAELLFAADRDDPQHEAYHDAVQAAARRYRVPVAMQVSDVWRPMVHKLDTVAAALAAGRYAVNLGFAGDDHRPRTPGWVRRYLTVLRGMGTGVVSCPDGYRPDDLPTQWAMTADIVNALGAMVPAGVEHLYCDDAVRELAKRAGCYAYLDDLLIEHLHPVAGHPGDEQHARVNSRDQYRRDRAAYRAWRDGGKLGEQVQILTALRRGETK